MKKNNSNRAQLELPFRVAAKMPPQTAKLEEAVNGAIMLEKPAFDTVMEMLQPECFYVAVIQQTGNSMPPQTDQLIPPVSPVCISVDKK